MDKQAVVTDIKEWLGLDQEIRAINRQLKEKRAEKRQITDSLVTVMRSHEIDCFDVTSGKLLYTRRKIKGPLSKKHLVTSLLQYFSNDPSVAKELGEYILASRAEKVKEGIRHKENK